MSFPESEAMTIKRLEVALRKKDFKLLKDGAYKLHEKFYSGHKFEYKLQLQQILDYIEKKDIPPEVNDILKETIIEILSEDMAVPSLEELQNEGEADDVQYENLDNLDELIKNMDEDKLELRSEQKSIETEFSTEAEIETVETEIQTTMEDETPEEALEEVPEEVSEPEETSRGQHKEVLEESFEEVSEEIQKESEPEQRSLLEQIDFEDVEIDLDKMDDFSDFSLDDDVESEEEAEKAEEAREAQDVTPGDIQEIDEEVAEEIIQEDSKGSLEGKPAEDLAEDTAEEVSEEIIEKNEPQETQREDSGLLVDLRRGSRAPQEKLIQPQHAGGSGPKVSRAIPPERSQFVVQSRQYDPTQQSESISKAFQAIPVSIRPEAVKTHEPAMTINNVTGGEATKEADNGFKDIALLYDDAHCEIDFSKIKDYRNHLNMLFSKNQKCGEEYNLLRHIAEITNVVDTSISDIEKILSTLTTTKNKMSFLTTSQSQNITKAFCMGKLDFEIPFVKKAQNPETAYSLIPMLGMSSIFVCAECNARTLKTDFNTKTLSVQCPECDGACFPDLYAVNSYNPDCNPIFWHRAFATLVSSKIWIIVNPPLDENKEIVFDFIKTAYKASAPEKIYLLTREREKREFYKQTFKNINPACELHFDYATQEKLCEDFINKEIMSKVYG